MDTALTGRSPAAGDGPGGRGGPRLKAADFEVVVCDYDGTLGDRRFPADPALRMPPVSRPAAEALRRLHREFGMDLILASNTRRGQDRRRALERAGIGGLFTAVIQSGLIGCAKPDREFYWRVLESAQCSPDRVLWAGNNPRNDVHGPVRWGMRAVLVRSTGRQPSEPLPAGVPVIGRLADLPGALT